jgi:hypothetical protein
MIRNSIILKTLAVFFAVEMFATALLPTFSWALTAGPTAPEATSFEPVDTTDMVNLITGDFVYNIPLLEVPGPAGGYPLSLSYHAGIKLDQDASWVGLGWTLNPGAINRSINGHADDYQDVTGTDRSFWEGGNTSTFTIGVNVGYGSLASVSAGLVFAEDTYKGSGTGYYYGAGLQEGVGMLSTTLQFQGGVSPYGDRFSSTGMSVGIGGASKIGLTASASAGVSFDQDGKASGRGSLGVGNLGATIATGGGSTFSVGGFTGSIHNSKSGNVSTSGYNYSADVPTPWGFNVRLGKSYQRYWIDETAHVLTNGALYFPSTLPSSNDLDNKAYDVYDLQYPDNSSTPPDETLAGGFIDYDSYSVLGQGISGGIRPFHYKSYLLRQNKKNGSQYKFKSYPLGKTPKPAFRFIGDFSNRYEHSINANTFSSDGTISNPLSFVFDANRITGENGNDGYDVDLNVLPGSKHVEWFTNIQINDNERTDEFGQLKPDAAIRKGFINCKALGFSRDDNSQIGGFKVTNESGITYHYALPVYSFDEHQYTGRVDEQGKHQFNVSKKPQKYAYTWLLTAVTGPDFVDTNLNGYADNADWGYWVNFEYGKWSGSYSWRNPASGFNKDVDHNFDTFSKGKKQVYYLNAIRTETHTALFVKEIRADGKGVVHQLKEAINTDVDYKVTGIDKGSYVQLEKLDDLGNTYIEHPVSTLKLHSIYLLQNKDLLNYEPVSDLATLGNVYYHSQNTATDIGKYIHGDFVIDIHDVSSDPISTDLKSKCLKKIEFRTDYSLTAATPNSYRSGLDVLNTAETTTGPLGKLTLRSLKILGRAEADLIPETKFNYELEEGFYASIKENQSADGVFHRLKLLEDISTLHFEKGETIECGLGSTAAYGFVYQVFEALNEMDVKFYQGAGYLFNSDAAIKFKKTKNPPYMMGFYDLWGNYKVDSDGSISGVASQTENVKRMTTSTSAKSVDVWSLREVKTPLGVSIKMQYESDNYKSALKSLSNIPIKGVESVPGGKTRILLYEDLAEYGLTEGLPINIRLLTAKRYDVKDPDFFAELRFNCNGVESTFIYQWYLDNTFGSYTIPIEKDLQNNSFVIDHDYTSKHPAGEICLEENEPYSEQNAGTVNCIDLKYLTASAPIFLGGEIISDKLFSPYGGDLRVKKLSLEQWDQTRSTEYEYFNGITSYEPLGLAVPIAKLNVSLNSCLDNLQQKVFDDFRAVSFDNIYQKFKSLFANARELPGPGVLYEWVRIKEQVERPDGIIELDGKAEYQFEVFSPKTLDLTIPGGVFSTNPLYQKIGSLTSYGATDFQNNYEGEVFELTVNSVQTSQSKKTVIKDFTSIMGSLKRVILYDKSDNKISETINDYLHDDFTETTYLDNLAPFKNQGTIAETFAEGRIILNAKNNTTDPDSYTLHGILSQKIKYPSIQTAQTSINYKTGIVNKSETLAFDFYSGEPVRTEIKDGYGNIFISENSPAYHHYNGMGFGHFGNKNMLTQGSSSIIYKIGENNAKFILSANATTWSRDIPIIIDPLTVKLEPAGYNIWRSQASYSWRGDDVNLVQGLYPEINFSPFNFSDPISNSVQWQKLSETKLSDVYSNVLEVSDINDNYAATRMSSDQTLILATASNAGYNDFAYSGAEDILVGGKFGGNVSIGEAALVTSEGLSHTGSSGLLLNPNSIGFTFEASKASLKNPFKTYHSSVWVKENSLGGLPSVYLIAETNDGVLIASATPLEKYKAGTWYLVSLAFDLPSSTDKIKVYVKNTSSEGLYIDDFRVQPQNSTLMGYVYNKWGELSHILDNNNLYTEYRYDGMGRLTEVNKETFKYQIVKTNEIIYKYGLQD